MLKNCTVGMGDTVRCQKKTVSHSRLKNSVMVPSDWRRPKGVQGPCRVLALGLAGA